MFEPEPFTPGAPITWTHYHEDGTVTERTGQVWAEAPQVSGQTTVWVQPDAPLATDWYDVIVVSRVSRPTYRVRNSWGVVTHRLPKGTVYSFDSDLEATGSMTLAAGSTARNLRELRDEAARNRIPQSA